MKYVIAVVFVFSLFFPSFSYSAEEETLSLSEKLVLSSEQKQELKEKYQEMGEKVKKLQIELRAEMARLGQELKKDKPSKGRIHKLGSKIKKINNKLFDYRIEEVMATKEILNTEQYRRLQEIRKERLEELREKVKKIEEDKK